MNLLRLNRWRKLILGGFVFLLLLLFIPNWGYHFNVGHVVRLAVAAGALWIAVDRL